MRKDSKMKTRSVTSVALLALCLGGFAVTEKAYAFTGWAGSSVTSQGGFADPTTVDFEDIGQNTQTFLSGVFGDFSSVSTQGAFVTTFPFNDGGPYWDFRMQAKSIGPGLTRALGWAVYPGITIGSATPAHCYPGHPSATLNNAPNGASKWACYFTAMSNPAAAGDWSSYSDKASISWNTDSVNCQPGSVFPNSGTDCRGNATLTCSGNSDAQALCVPITTWLGWGSNGNPSYFTGPNSLGPTINAPPQTKLCLLWEIWGSFPINNSIYNGVEAYEYGSNWYMFTSAGTGATVDCVE